MVQGNIKQEAKWQPEQIQESLWLYGRYTQANWSSDLIIWPEAAITLPLSMAKEITEQLDVAAKQHHSTLITGIPVVEPGAAYNAMIALGMGSGIYYKRHLVPFGEYIPLRPLFSIFAKAMQIPMSDSIPGSQDQQPIKANGIYVAPYICYEVAYPVEFLTFLPKSQILLTITDDSWFGHSIAAAQHLQMAQMRAIETGRYLLFSSNTGITAVIDSRGNIVKEIPTFKEMALTAEVYPMQGSTPWMIWRLYPLLGLIVVSLGAVLFKPILLARGRARRPCPAVK
jgi:apolipoprotein N-acyltransferase